MTRARTIKRQLGSDLRHLKSEPPIVTFHVLVLDHEASIEPTILVLKSRAGHAGASSRRENFLAWAKACLYIAAASEALLGSALEFVRKTSEKQEHSQRRRWGIVQR